MEPFSSHESVTDRYVLTCCWWRLIWMEPTQRSGRREYPNRSFPVCDFDERYEYRPVNCLGPTITQAYLFPILNSITMRFSLFAVLSGLAALTVANPLPAENVQRDAPSEDVSGPTADLWTVTLAAKQRMFTVMTGA